MARNQEKAQSMLYRFREAEMAELGVIRSDERRPPHTKMATTVQEAERWRSQVVREITRKVSRIHDPGLTDAQIRELNDDINKLFKEKWMWEKRIHELGGPDWTKVRSASDNQGKEVFGVKGYKYFGRAKELPEVKDFFDKMVAEKAEQKDAKTAGKSRLERSQLDAEYFGFLPSPELLDHERELQAERLDGLMQQLGPIPDDLYADDPIAQLLAGSAHLLKLPFIPALADVEHHMVEERKRDLLARLAGAGST